jgi:VCBS repeat-containing protein
VTQNDAAGAWSWEHTPVNGPNAPTTVTITAADASSGLSASVTFSLTVDNVPPTITEFSFPATAGEGSAVTLSGAATDPGTEDPLGFLWLIVGPSGNPTQYHSATAAAVLPDDGTYDVSLLVGDGDWGIAGGQGQIVVSNVAPTIAISGAGRVNAGATYELTLAAVTDPGPDTVSSYVVHWGDGSTETFTTAGLKTHAYNTGGTTYAVTVDLVDEDGTHSNRANPLSVTVNGRPTNVALSNSSLAENNPSGTTVGTFSTTDPDAGDTFTYSLVSGIGSTDNAAFTIDVDGNLKTAAGLDFETQSSYSIRVRSTDAGSLGTEDVFTVSVTDVNEAPTVAVPGAQTAYEDVDKAISGITVGDPGGGSLTVTLAVSHGKLTLGTTTGLSVSGNGSGAVTLSGSIADLNAALSSLLYRGGLNYSGTDTLSITASDGSLSSNGSVALTVKSAAVQADDLKAQVTALRHAGVLSPLQALGLTVWLDLKGNALDGVRVQGFLVTVKWYRQLGLLTSAQADALLGPGTTLLLSVTRR